ncbi:MAG TPA: hypothetical protein VF282_01665 [Bacillota bacterium]
MKVFMRIPEPREWRFDGPCSVKSILERLEINPETVIVIHGDTLLTPDDIVENDDEIEIRPAISGGETAAAAVPAPGRVRASGSHRVVPQAFKQLLASGSRPAAPPAEARP